LRSSRTCRFTSRFRFVFPCHTDFPGVSPRQGCAIRRPVEERWVAVLHLPSRSTWRCLRLGFGVMMILRLKVSKRAAGQGSEMARANRSCCGCPAQLCRFVKWGSGDTRHGPGYNEGACARARYLHMFEAPGSSAFVLVQSLLLISPVGLSRCGLLQRFFCCVCSIAS